jgi:hypothetical protein
MAQKGLSCQRYRDVCVNAGLCSRLCLILFNYSETAVSELFSRRPDRHQDLASYTS